MKSILGTRSVSPLSSGAYIGGGDPGASLITHIEVPKSPSYLRKVKVHVRSNQQEKTFRLRLRILEGKDRQPGKDLLQQNKIVTSDLKKGWITFDFENEAFELTDNVFIGIEWIEALNNAVTVKKRFSTDFLYP